MSEKTETIVARYGSRKAAEDALPLVSKALRQSHDAIYEGALVARKRSGDVEMHDLKQFGIGDVVAEGVDAGVFLAVGGAKLMLAALAAGTALLFDGAKLVMNGAGRVAGVATSAVALPGKRFLDDFRASEAVTGVAGELRRGEAALVIVAESSAAADLQKELAKAGGEVL
jgi:hypothetical protein